MCVVSMVMDHFHPLIPEPERTVPAPSLPAVPPFNPMIPQVPTAPPFSWITPQTMRAELDELRILVMQFKELYEAAKKIDIATKQPDCEDPEKIKLVQRVDQLEARLAEIEMQQAMERTDIRLKLAQLEKKPAKKRPKKKASKKPRSMLG